MAKNIKYIRWATKVLKIIVVINILNSLFGLCLLLSGATIIPADTNVAQTSNVLSVASYIFSVFTATFIMYTAARGLKLFADVAEKILTPSEQPASLSVPS